MRGTREGAENEEHAQGQQPGSCHPAKHRKVMIVRKGKKP